MKSIAASAVLSIAALSSCSLAVVTMNIAKNSAPGLKLSRRMLSARKDFSASLENQVNQIVDSNYIISVQVGTPAQGNIALAIDTGSSDVWVLDPSAGICAQSGSQSGQSCTTFNSQDSSTFKVVDANGFKISYADGTGAQGDYFTDVLSFGGQTLTNQTMGIAYESTLSPGLLGIGYDQNEASTGDNPPFVYSSVIDSLVTQGLISLKAYSLYLDDLEASTGSLLFGGLDSDKYQGNLVQMPIIPQTVGGQTLFTAFAVDMVSLAVSSSPGNSTPVTQSAFDIPVILDSGTTLTYVPESLLLDLVNQLNGAVDQQGFPFVDCSLRDDNAGLTFDFGLGTSDRIVIKVPAAELIYDSDVYTGGSTPDVSLQNPCALGFQAQNGAPYVLGDNFLRSAYVVYDLKNNLIALGQTNFDSTTSSILDFSADATTIPVRSGVATSAVVEPTASGGTATTDGSGGETTSFPQTEFTAATASTTPFTIPGNGLPTLSSSTDSFASPSNSASSSSSTQKSSPAVASAELDRGGLAVVGISLIFAVLGGGWFLA